MIPGADTSHVMPTLETPIIKVCGLTNTEDARHAIHAGANALGFVAVEESPRAISPDQIRSIVGALPTGTPTVLVTVESSPNRILELCELSGTNHVQLCGPADPPSFRGFPFPVLRRIGVDDSAKQEILSWTAMASYFILDHPASPGGSGKKVDLDVAKELAGEFPCVLAGGLDGASVARAIEVVRPLGVDASSRLEYHAGRKDPTRVHDFVHGARRALEALA